MRDHSPVVLEEFNGLYKRGDEDSCPHDHFVDCDNIQYIESGFETRDGLGTLIAKGNVLRIYNYKMVEGESLLILDTNGDIYHALLDGSNTVYGPVLNVAGMTDFGFQAFNGRAYITPFKTFTDANGVDYQKGIQNEFVYVYLGAGVTARKAAGSPPISATALTVAPAGSGFSDVGFHILAVIYETDTGYLTSPGPVTVAGLPNFGSATSVSTLLGYDITNITISPDTFVTKRHIVATKAILSYNGNQDGYQFFFVPLGNIDNNTATTKHVDFYDIDLLDDASHLMDNFASIPAGVTLTLYNNRLVLTTTFDNISLAYLSSPGEPEAIDQVDGILIVPLDGNPITNAQEFRDVLYLCKKTRTHASSDNGDVPSTWSLIPLDQGIGASVHGIAQVLDSGGVNVEYILVVYFGGLYLFSGLYSEKALTWKIEDLWLALDRNNFANIQILNDSLTKIIYITLPDKKMLIGDYKNGLNSKDIKWSKWRFDIEATTIALIETNVLVIGAEATI